MSTVAVGERLDPEYWSELHADVENRLAEVARTLDAAATMRLDWSVGGRSTNDMLRQLDADRAAVRTLDLRMPIVAPMKSGKSTIINAIVGYDLLPARAEAMTTVPTRIVLVEGLDEPMMVLTEADSRMLTDLAQSLQPHVEREFRDLADRYSQLEPLLRLLRDGTVGQLGPVWEGRRPILAGLTALNDLLRVAAIRDPGDDVIGRLEELPTIRTPFWPRPELDGTQSAGTLSMIDTPGPDESGIGGRLTGAVLNQLRSSHVVAVLLDYTAMGRDADEKIRELTDPVVKQLGREKLYAVVNKVDQRRPGDRDQQGVRRFVQRDLELVDSSTDQRIFETKGRRALAAARVLASFPTAAGDQPIPDTPEVRALLAETYGEPEDREDALREWNLRKLRERAERMWLDSGLPSVLEHAIGRLRSEAVPVIFSSALKRLEPQLVAVRDVAGLRLNAAEADRGRVEAELQALRGELDELARAQQQAPDARAFTRKIEKRLKAVLTEAGQAGHYTVDTLADRAADEWQKPRDSIFGRLVFGSLSRAFRSLVEGRRERSDGIYEFKSAEDAQDFTRRLTAAALEQLRKILEASRERMNADVIELAAEAVADQDRKVRPILERASNRLSERFQLDLAVPPLRLDESDLEVEPPLPEVEENRIERERTRTVRQRKWYTLWTIKVPVTVKETYDEVTRVHLVSRRNLMDQLRTAFDNRMAEISGEITRYTVDHLTNELNAYFRTVDRYLRKYATSLEQAQHDMSRDEAEQEEVTGRLNGIVAAVDDHLAAVASFWKRLPGQDDDRARF